MAIARIEGGSGERTLIDGTLPGMNYRGVLGRGLGNSWELIFPATWSRVGGLAPNLEEIESIDIVFGYLTSPERSRERRVVTAAIGGQSLTNEDPKPTDKEEALASRQSCTGKLDELTCVMASYQRQLERENRFEAAKTLLPAASQNTAASFAFQSSPAARRKRVHMLDLWNSVLPSATQFIEEAPTLDAESGRFLDCFATAPGAAGCAATPEDASQAESYAARLGKVFPALLGDRSAPWAPPDIAAMTSRIVREEMLAFPDEPAPVGPIELLRVWRSLEALLGSANGSGTAAAPAAPAVASRRPTLLAEIASIAVRLEGLIRLLNKVNESVKGPVAVVRRLVDDYETSRMQTPFAHDLAWELREGAQLRDADDEVARRRSDAAQELATAVHVLKHYE